MTYALDSPDRTDSGGRADRWFRLFPNEHLTLVRMDVAPSRDEHVNSMAVRLAEIAGTANGNIALDLTVVEFYSWTWIRTLIDLSARCSSLGGQLRLHGVNAEGAQMLKANKGIFQTGRSPPRRDVPREGDFLPIGGRSTIATPNPERNGRRLLRSAA